MLNPARPLVLFALLLLAVSAAADQYSVDTEFGPGTATRDTDTGLDWLDLTVTVNLSYDAMQPLLQPGGTYESWRYATEPEWIDMVTDSGAPIVALLDPAWGPEVLTLLELFGINQSYTRSNGELFRGSFGIFDIETVSDNRQLGGFSVVTLDDVFTGGSLFGRASLIPDHVGRTTTGHWLVREVVVSNESASWSRIKTLFR